MTYVNADGKKSYFTHKPGYTVVWRMMCGELVGHVMNAKKQIVMMVYFS